jgi:hypothetical protein
MVVLSAFPSAGIVFVMEEGSIRCWDGAAYERGALLSSNDASSFPKRTCFDGVRPLFLED